MDSHVPAWGYAFIQPSSSQKPLGTGLKADPHSSAIPCCSHLPPALRLTALHCLLMAFCRVWYGYIHPCALNDLMTFSGNMAYTHSIPSPQSS